MALPVYFSNIFRKTFLQKTCKHLLQYLYFVVWYLYTQIFVKSKKEKKTSVIRITLPESHNTHANWKKASLEVSYKETWFWKFRKIQRKDLCQSFFFNKIAGLRAATLFKKRLCRCFLVEFYQIFKNTFLQNISARLLLKWKSFLTANNFILFTKII